MGEHRPDSWIVVGAGSAGCVVAARLSEEPGRVVTLLEAGPDLREDDTSDAISGRDFLSAMTEPGRTFRDLDATRVTGGRPSPYPRGRGVGGSSVVNGLIALHGDDGLYRSWGWLDVDDAWAAVALPEQQVAPSELGVVDRALLRAAPDAELAVLTRRGGRRVTSAEAMLWPARDRPNLTIRPDALVDRVEFRGRRAHGVRLADGSVIGADHVVLCAGAVHSPAILLRSAIDTPGVGDGLQDHPSVAFTLALRSGAETDSSGLVIGSILRRGDLQLLPMNHLGADGPSGLGVLMVALMRPRGRSGSVRLASDDPFLDPIVDFALLQDRHDAERLVAGVRQALGLLEAPAFVEIVDAVHIDAAGTSTDVLDDDDSIERWLQTATGDYVHASSSCAMGTVVDDDGRLVGYHGAYVCDASVFPSIPDANTHLPTTMLAERLTARWRRAGERPSG